MNNPTEEDALIARVQAGDYASFEAVIDLHLVHLRTFIALKAPVACLVDEIAHEAFVFAFNHIAKFTPGTSFRAWIRSIAWNLLRAEIQRHSREQTHQARFAEHQQREHSRELSPGGSDEADFLAECVASLPRKCAIFFT
jgi:DNA-directed RNA polymerase specialized sigma24 family protein